MSTASERQARRRERRERERAERRQRYAELEGKKKQVTKSSKIMAKWYWNGGGIKIAGVPIRGGFFYAGANMRQMVEPSISEPSLLNPLLTVSESSEGMEPLGPYPIYQYLSDEQRRGYIEFLASDRTETKDIGFVFLYLYGLERRLIIDTQKPDTVSEEEHDDIIRELLRLYNTFGKQSRSLSHYVAMLLLYDGSIFDTMSYGELDAIYEFSSDEYDTQAKMRDKTDNSDAMSYLIVSRLKEHGYDIPIYELINAGKGRFLRTTNAAMSGIDAKELYDPTFEKLIKERVSFVDFSRVSATGGRSLKGQPTPKYYPSSPTLRNAKEIGITRSVCVNPEEQEVPLKKISDMVSTAYHELQNAKNVLDTSSIRDIDKVQFDALAACSPDRCAIETFLARTKSTATYVSMQTIDDDLRRRFGQSIQYTSKGQMSVISQQLTAAVAASLGWQAVLPETVDGMVSASWRVDKDSKIVMFKRGMAHNKMNGKRCAGLIFGKDQDSYAFSIPGQWLVPSCLGYIYAWFIQRCPDSFTRDDLFKFSSEYLPKFSDQGIKNNQVSFFFALMYATYSLNLSTHGIKQCIQAVPFEQVQDLVFSLVNDAFGRMIPTDVMAALEELYKKADRDKAMILYDYQSGSYQLHAASNIGFFIDEERLADTIKDTSSVHDLLNEAINSGEKEIMLGTDASDEEAQMAEDAEDLTEQGSENIDSSDDDYSIDTIKNDVIAFFGDSDEASTEDLLTYIVEKKYALTNAEAMSVITNVNDAAGEELIEIDGADVYLNV